MPKLSVLGLEPTGAGVYPVGKEGIRLFVDGTAIKDCASVRLELTKPNYFFADFPDDSSQCVSTTIPAQSHEQLEITAKQIPTPAYYELRAVCLDKGGRVLGEVSDPITIQRY